MTALELQDILNTTTQEVRELLNTDWVVLFKFNAQWIGEIVFEATSGQCQSLLNEQIEDPCFKGHYIRLYRDGRIRAISDVERSDLAQCHKDLLARYQVKANLAVPVLFNDNLWGLMIAHECQRPRHWSQEELKLLSEVASQASIAIYPFIKGSYYKI